MKTLGAELTKVQPGLAEIEMPFNKNFAQHLGYIHAGAITTIVDSACGAAAWTLMPPGHEILSIEFKVNFVSPAKGHRFRARGEVLRPGKAITATRGEVWALDEHGAPKKMVAAMQATMIFVKPPEAKE